MGFETPEKSWIEFAKEKQANAEFHSQGGRWSDACWSISRESEFMINFLWGMQPNVGRSLEVTKRTDYFFFLNTDSNFSFKMYRNDFLTRIALIFNFKRVKAGDEELDRDYVFISNDGSLVKSFTPAIRQFVQRNTAMDFLMEIEGAKVGIEGKCLLIQVNELLKEKESIETFFDFGKTMQEMINKRF